MITVSTGERGRKFLQYLFDQYRNGQPHIKAYHIATEVFGRSSAFDPILDPIVRVEAVRLRNCLGAYYDTLGNEVHIRMSVPKGKYIIEFDRYGDGVATTRGSEPYVPTDNIERLTSPRLGEDILSWALYLGAGFVVLSGMILATQSFLR